jgi:hypothetical protein
MDSPPFREMIEQVWGLLDDEKLQEIEDAFNATAEIGAAAGGNNFQEGRRWRPQRGVEGRERRRSTGTLE